MKRTRLARGIFALLGLSISAGANGCALTAHIPQRHYSFSSVHEEIVEAGTNKRSRHCKSVIETEPTGYRGWVIDCDFYLKENGTLELPLGAKRAWKYSIGSSYEDFVVPADSQYYGVQVAITLHCPENHLPSHDEKTHVATCLHSAPPLPYADAPTP